MIKIVLPAKIFENNFSNLLEKIALIEAEIQGVEIDFSKVQYWIPAAIVSFCVNYKRWLSTGKPVSIVNMENCPALTYLQRVDFLRYIDVQLPENFQRHDNAEALVEIHPVPKKRVGVTDELATRLARCLAGTSDGFDFTFRLAEYALGEILNNIRHHAECDGFVCGQYVESKNWVRVGIADCGIGIQKSFIGTKYEAECTSDIEALKVAMRPWVTSKSSSASSSNLTGNRGIGLKMVKEMILESNGEMVIASGNAWLRYNGQNQSSGQLPNELTVQGVSLSLKFERGLTDEFDRLMRHANNQMKLTSEPDDDTFFL